MKKILFLYPLTAAIHPSTHTTSEEENKKKAFVSVLIRHIDKEKQVEQELEVERIMKYGTDVNYMIKTHPRSI